MRTPRLRLPILAAFTLLLAGSASRLSAVIPFEVPARLSDQEFWRLVKDLSEPDGTFRSENLISNEMVLPRLLPEVVSHTKTGGVYLGVGPEQNFSYMAVMRPRIAFITDIRRGNLHVLLMYKALFEISADRADFISRLFTKPRPAGLSTTSTAKALMDAYWTTKTGDDAAYAANLAAIKTQLTKGHTFPLPAEDVDGVASAYRAFYFYGPGINYSASTSLSPLGGGNSATYWDLMTQADASGQAMSYLASEEKFKIIKDLYSKNLIIPLVGNFSGPKTIRAIGTYVKSLGATVTAFYVSTVEPYLRRDGSLPTFCASVATLPMDDASFFIRPGNVQQLQQINAPGATLPAAVGPVPQVGTYQLGVVAPLKNGCG